MSRVTRNTKRSENEFWVKLHPAGRDMILAVCDSELVGRTFSDDEMSITVYEDFYRGVLVDEEGLKKHMRSATILNLMGERCISVAEEFGWVDREKTIHIGRIEHAQAALILDDREENY